MSGIINERGGRYIHVFDTEGKPVCKYLLDRSVCGIDVHENEQIIYAVDANSDDPIVAFRITQPLLYSKLAGLEFNIPRQLYRRQVPM